MEYSEAKRKFGEASQTKPVFVHAECYDGFDSDRGSDEKPWADFDCAVIGFTVDSSGISCVNMAIIDEGRNCDLESDFMEHPVFGDYFSIEPELLVISDVQRPERMNDLYEAFKKMHTEGGYIVYGMLYEEEPTTNGKYVYYQPVENTANVWDLSEAYLNDGSKVSSVDDAFKWLLEQHPAYLEGVIIMQNCPSGDWLRMAPPANFIGYPAGAYENYNNRYEYAQQAAEEWGVVLGTERAEDILKALHEKEEVANVVKEPEKIVESDPVQTEQVVGSVGQQSVQPSVAQPSGQSKNPVKKPGSRGLPNMPETHTSTGGEEYQMS